MWQSVEILKYFNTFNFETNFLENENENFSKNWGTVF